MARKQNQLNEDEALALALQMQFEREAEAAQQQQQQPTRSPPRSSSRPPELDITDEEIARRVQAQEEERYRRQQQQQSTIVRGRSLRDRTTSGAATNSGTIVAIPGERSDEELARRLAAEEEVALSASAIEAAHRTPPRGGRSSSSKKKTPNRNTTTTQSGSGGYVFPAPTPRNSEPSLTGGSSNDVHVDSGGYIFPAPSNAPTEIGSSMSEDEIVLDEPHSSMMAPPPSSATAPQTPEDEDRELAKRMEQEMQDELVAERLQQREQVRANKRAAAEIHTTQSNDVRRRKICGSLLTIAVVVGAVVGLVYYFVILGGGVPTIDLTPEDFANEDPFDAMKPEDANAWKNNGNGVQLVFINALETKWYQYFYDAVDDWENGYPDSLTLGTEFNQMPGSGSHDPTCNTVNGKIKVCNGNYGNTRWKGINEVMIDSSGFIFASAARMNEFYLGNNNDDQMQYTMCHEMGHAFGLPHTDERFDNPDLGDCMDYTNNPHNNRQPSERNYIFLYEMYGLVPGATPFNPPTPAPTMAPTPAPTFGSTLATKVVSQTSEVPPDDDGTRQRRLQRHVRRAVPQQQQQQHGAPPSPVLDLKEPFPEWLTTAVDSVFHKAAGRRLQQHQWRVLHANEHGEEHEVDLPNGFRLRVHYLLAHEDDE